MEAKWIPFLEERLTTIPSSPKPTAPPRGNVPFGLYLLYTVLVSLLTIVVCRTISKPAASITLNQKEPTERGSSPPTRPEKSTLVGAVSFPNVIAEPDFPSEHMISAGSKFTADQVHLRLKNSTGEDLKLLAYTIAVFYHQPREDYKRDLGWTVVPLPPNYGFDAPPVSFTEKTGWFYFYIRTGDNKDFRLGPKGIYYAPKPTMVIEKTGNRGAPYRAVYAELEE